jgi:hypothetical protein
MTDEQITTLITWVVSVAFPLLVGLVTTKDTNSLTKALLLAAIAAFAGFLSQLLAAISTHVTFSLVDALLTAGGAWLFAVTSHKEIWTKTNLLGALQQIGYHPAGDEPKHSA